MSIFNKLNETQTKQREQTVADYWRYLVRLDADKADDDAAAALADYGRVLGKSLQQIEADHRGAQQAKAQQQMAARMADADQAAVGADAEHLAACKVRQDEFAKMNAAVAATAYKLNVALASRSEHQDAVNAIRNIAKDAPALYAAITADVEQAASKSKGKGR